MIKLSIFLTRRSDLTHEEFIEYWTKKHTPMLADLPPGAVQVSRYVQLQSLGEGVPGFVSSEYDGVAELWVDSVESAADWFTSETYKTVIATDEEEFLDRNRTRFLFATESTIFG